MAKLFVAYLALLSLSFLGVSAHQCTEETLCPNNQCCSRFGYCGTGEQYCCEGCVSQCSCNTLPTPALKGIVDEAMFNEMLPHRDSGPCLGSFYDYRAFLLSAANFPEFGTTGDEDTRKREIAAFLAQTSHATAGKWDAGPLSSYTWGYCWIREGGHADQSSLPSYCEESGEWPCASGKKYYGRGPMHLSYNYNYGEAGKALGYDLLSHPEAVDSNPYTAFQTAFWFWMTPQPPKPSCHDVIIGNFTPSAADIAAGRLPGFGLCTNIINGGVECGGSVSLEQEVDRLGYYERYCRLLGVEEGDNLTCDNMQPYAGLSLDGSRTEGGWDGAPDGRYSWGYCWIREGMTTDPSLLSSYCVPSEEWPCASGKKYYGRGPIQLSYNYNYGPAGKGLGYDLLTDPDMVEFDPYVSFEAAFWFWMTPQPPKPSCHDVIIGNFTPSAADIAAGRLPGFGLCTNIINGGVECGKGFSMEEFDRVGYYSRYCKMLGVEEGANTSCREMQAYPDGHLTEGARAGGGGVRSQ